MFDEISKAFGVKESDAIFYTWGDTIHAPCKKMPPDYLIVHEEVHHEPPQEILDRMKALEAEIAGDLAELEGML